MFFGFFFTYVYLNFLVLVETKLRGRLNIVRIGFVVVFVARIEVSFVEDFGNFVATSYTIVVVAEVLN